MDTDMYMDMDKDMDKDMDMDMDDMDMIWTYFQPTDKVEGVSRGVFN